MYYIKLLYFPVSYLVLHYMLDCIVDSIRYDHTTYTRLYKEVPVHSYIHIYIYCPARLANTISSFYAIV